jgi:hypothetical protein
MKFQDPRWLDARYAGTCAQTGCGARFAAGSRIFYYPMARAAYGSECGHADEQSRDWQARRADEDGY